MVWSRGLTELSLFVNDHRNDWDNHLPYLTMAYRATQHDSTKCTPNLLMLGHEIRCPIDLMFEIPQDDRLVCPIKYVEWIQVTMRNSYNFAYKQLQKSAKRQKENYDRNLKVREYKANDWVWRWYPPKANKKLGLGWTGPFLVLSRLSDLLYKIQYEEKSKPYVVHVDHLKHYLGTKTPHNWNLPETAIFVNTTNDVDTE